MGHLQCVPVQHDSNVLGEKIGKLSVTSLQESVIPRLQAALWSFKDSQW